MLEPGPAGFFTAITGGWRRLVTIAVLDVLAGLIAVTWPGATVLVLAIVFGVILLATGAALLYVSIRVRSVIMAFHAVLALIAGMICFAHPGTGVTAVLIGCAIWFLILGLAYLGRSLAAGSSRLWWATLGILSLVAGVAMVANRDIAIATVGLLVGISFLVRGLVEFALARRLYAMHRGHFGRPLKAPGY